MGRPLPDKTHGVHLLLGQGLDESHLISRIRLLRANLLELAAQLGSDVPFALHGGTALGTGRGEELATVLARNTFHWVLAFSPGGLSTAAVWKLTGAWPMKYTGPRTVANAASRSRA